MSVPRGEVFGFLGPNGAGKTTAIKLLVGLIRPSAGQGTLLGEPLGDRETRRRIGYLPELFRYQEWLTAREVLVLHSELAGIPSVMRARESDSALDTVGLVRRADDRVGTYSKGMQQRLGLAVALLGQPELVFLDEPTSALDPVGRHDVREVIRSLKQRGTTVFLNSHLLTEVEQVCDRVAVIDRGRVIAIGALDEVVGSASGVRVRVNGLTTVAEEQLRTHGGFTVEQDWYTFQAVSDEEVPALVANLVRLGGQVHAVERQTGSLESRFLELMEATGHS
ncbi:MAG: ABC transporter ATP-binding protein [Chloroflexi bacterium]|nr:ABC transporter ATP-binding protein [Chloroflexota bacterium]